MEEKNNESGLFTPNIVDSKEVEETVEEVKEEIKEPKVEEKVDFIEPKLKEEEKVAEDVPEIVPIDMGFETEPKEEIKEKVEEVKETVEEAPKKVEEVIEPEKKEESSNNDILFHVTTDGKINDVDNNKNDETKTEPPVNTEPVNNTANATVSNPQIPGTNKLLMVLPAIVILTIGAIVYFVFLNGGTKTLSCKMSVTEMNIKVDQTMEMSFKDGKFTEGQLIQAHDVSAYGSAEELANSQNMCDTLKGYGNSVMSIGTCRQVVEDGKIVIYAGIEVASKYKNEKNDIEEVKKGMTDGGYTCTIK